MTDAELITYYGGPAQLAKKLGWTDSKAIQRIHNWRTRGIPPAVKLNHPDLFLMSLQRSGITEVAVELAQPTTPAQEVGND